MTLQLRHLGDRANAPRPHGSVFTAPVVSSDAVRGLQGRPLRGGRGPHIFPTPEAGESPPEARVF